MNRAKEVRFLTLKRATGLCIDEAVGRGNESYDIVDFVEFRERRWRVLISAMGLVRLRSNFASGAGAWNALITVLPLSISRPSARTIPTRRTMANFPKRLTAGPPHNS